MPRGTDSSPQTATARTRGPRVSTTLRIWGARCVILTFASGMGAGRRRGGGGVVSGRRGWSARCDGGARWLMLQGQLRWGQAWAAPLRRDLRAGAPGGALWRHIPIYKPYPHRREGAPLEVDLKTEKCPESFFCFFPSLGQRVV